MWSCKHPAPHSKNTNPVVKVELSNITDGHIPDYLQFSAKTIYLNKSNLIAPISGYVTKVNTQLGDIVKKGQVLFEMKTSEAYLMQVNDNKAVTNYGSIKVYAAVSGRVMNLSIMNNNVFIDKGSVLCTLMSSNDLKLQVNIPVEYMKWGKIGNKCKVILPDSTELAGQFLKYLPQVNNASQTLKIITNINTNKFLPENMIVNILLDKSTKKQKQILPISCLQTDALMTKFWVMKVINDSTAVQTEVNVGNQNNDKFELLSPLFNKNDMFISKGAYGLEDTVLISVVK